jgi:antitoxin (DNA-binding transcriptional repressor) of toxin-antitoxin stability system
MIGGMAVVHMSEADVVKDIVAVLAKVRQGSEIVIEQGNRPVAIIKPSQPAGRMISEVIAALEANGANAVLDEDFARDVEAGINAHREPWNPPSWE